MAALASIQFSKRVSGQQTSSARGCDVAKQRHIKEPHRDACLSDLVGAVDPPIATAGVGAPAQDFPERTLLCPNLFQKKPKGLQSISADMHAAVVLT